MDKKIELSPEQNRASTPEINVWVQANAGTGKTFVLVQRLLRILFRAKSLNDCGILCLTYTKAAAGEMRTRILKRLSEWATAPDDVLREMLENVVREYGERNSAGTEETREVFNDVFSNSAYAAESYGLVYWSHADGWAPYGQSRQTRWIGQDTGDGDNRMNISDFVSILEKSPHFSFIMFDSCFMSSVEVAYELRRYTDYYIGSPTENPGPGAPYDLITPLMAGDNAAVDMASVYFKHYEDKYNGGINISNSNWTGGTSICVMRTSALEALASATAQALPEEKVDGDALSRLVFDYDQRSAYTSSYIGYFDFKQLMGELTDEASFDGWEQAFEDAIAYWVTTEKNYSQVVGMFSMEGTHGVTHYIPNDNESHLNAYRSTSWYQDAGLAKLGW